MLERFRHLRFPLSPARRKEWLELLASHPRQAMWFAFWMRSQRKGHSALADGVPWVPFDAARWLRKNVHRGTSVFEWGSGGSTLFFARRARSVVSVEHEPAWHASVAAALRQMSSAHVDLRLVPAQAAEPAAIGKYGSEHSRSRGLSFESYVKTIEAYADAGFDLIAIDGRARMACLDAAWRKVRVGGHVFLDNSDYARYQTHLRSPPGFVRRDFRGASPYGGALCTQSTVWSRLS